MASRQMDSDRISHTVTDIEANAESLSLRAMEDFGLFLMVIGLSGNMLWLHAMADVARQWGIVVSVFSLAAQGFAAFRLRLSHPRLSRLLLLVGPLASLGFLIGLRGAIFYPWAVSLLVIANFAIRPHQGVLAAATGTLILVGLVPAGPILYSALALTWLTVVIEWLSTGRLHTALAWAWQSHQRSTELLETLRDRQAELNRTLKALDEAYGTLRHTNIELVAARREAEEARVLKEQFVLNVSHELRTPLNLVVGFAEMMYLEPQSYGSVGWTPELTGDIGRIYRAGQHLQSLVNDILDLSRIDAKRLPVFREFTDIRAVIAGTVETFMPLLEQHHLFCHTEWPEELPTLYIDRTRIRQVLLNLLNNAFRYTDAGGITVRVELTQDALVVSFQDTGVGIAEDKLDMIFEQFTQVDGGLRGRGGAGLGLAICREFIGLHGGRLWVESQVGVGSTFSFSLPLPKAMPQVVALQRTPDRRKGDLSDTPVIVLDPDPSIALMLRRYLDDRPLLSAASVGEAEYLVAKHHPLAVIVNQMPGDSDEAWLARLGPISDRFQVPILRCSLPSSSWLARTKQIDDCLAKPITRELLAETIGRHCEAPRSVLVVDDDPGFVALVARMLSTISPTMRVLKAYSGSEALSLAHEEQPDVVLLDLLMPEMHGLKVVEGLRADPTLAQPCVIVITATSYAEEMLLHYGGHFTITRRNGITVGTIVELVRVTLRHLHPDYTSTAGPSLPEPAGGEPG